MAMRGRCFATAIALRKEAVILRAVYEPGPLANASASRLSKPSFEIKPILENKVSQSGLSFLACVWVKVFTSSPINKEIDE
jgi:hypothetical protein